MENYIDFETMSEVYDAGLKMNENLDVTKNIVFKEIIKDYFGSIYHERIKCAPVEIECNFCKNEFRIKTFKAELNCKNVEWDFEFKDVNELKKVTDDIEDLQKDKNIIDFFEYNYYDLTCHTLSEKQVHKIINIFNFFQSGLRVKNYYFYPFILLKESNTNEIDKLYGIVLDDDSKWWISGFGDDFEQILMRNPVYYQIIRYFLIGCFGIKGTNIPISGKGLTNERTKETIKECIVESIFNSLGLEKASFYTKLLYATYETSKNGGSINYFEPDLLDMDMEKIMQDNVLISFNNISEIKISENEIRKIRKIMQMSSEEISLAVFKSQEYEWTIKGILDKRKQNNTMCKFIFHDGKKWECVFRSEKIVYDGISFNMSSTDTSERKDNDFTRFNITKDNARSFAKLVNKFKKQLHGTMIIITKEAKEEIERLEKCGRAIGIRKINFFEDNDDSHCQELILLISSIDGAIIMNEKGECFGIGVILDGVATEEGNIGRGSRYNSAKTYITSRPKEIECVAVVISEDGTIDILPKENEL